MANNIISMNYNTKFSLIITVLCSLFLSACKNAPTPSDFSERTIIGDKVCLDKFPEAKKLADAGVMMYADCSRLGIPYSKDPHVVFFKGRYLMYFSIPPYAKKDKVTWSGWVIGVAESSNLIEWKKIGEILPSANAPYEKKGICAPGAIVRDGKVHLFYQTYGNGPKDAICHAVSDNGITFERNKTNPIFSPDGNWNNGRAIDAEVVLFKGKYFLYYATRDPKGKIQLQGVASTDINSNFDRNTWKHLSKDKSILQPELEWEGKCIEGASCIVKNDKLYMFYAGAYNNAPQQVGVAVSDDGVNFKRLFDKPFLPNGKPGEWNSSESGHPHIFLAPNGDSYLFYQGNNNKGKSWLLSNVKVKWENSLPKIDK